MKPIHEEPTVSVPMPRDEAEALSYAISDILCWHRGFVASRGPDAGSGDWGCYGLQKLCDFNIKLKRQLEPKD